MDLLVQAARTRGIGSRLRRRPAGAYRESRLWALAEPFQRIDWDRMTRRTRGCPWAGNWLHLSWWVVAATFGTCLVGCPEAGPEDSGLVSIFDGRTLTGWRSEPEELASAWSVREGAIQGRGIGRRLAYLVYSEDELLRDFDLRFSYRMLTEGNTGVELRARPDPTGKRPFEGYHADLGHVGIGPEILGAWDFHFATRQEFPCPRGTRLVIHGDGTAQSTTIERAIQAGDIQVRDWNQCLIRARGNHLQFFINGRLSSEFIDGVSQGRLEGGLLAFQLHDDRTIVQFKEILLRSLP